MTARRRPRSGIIRERGTIEVMRIDSRVLRRNALGDPSVRYVPVYLPPHYAASRARYPVLVALTGFTGRGCMLLNATPWGEALNERLDRLQAQRAIGPMIVIMPDCFTRLGGSQYLNSSATGHYSDHLLHEVIPQLDATYRTLATGRHRGAFGKSSGGYGALVLGMRHPDVFGAVACHSGDMAFEYCYLPDFPKLIRMLEEHRGIAGFVRAFEAAPRKTGELIEAMNMLAMASCYSPNRSRRPLSFDLPFAERTGALVPAVWRRWLAQDPLHMLPAYASNLRRLRGLFFDCGRRDEFNLQLGARQLTAELGRRRIRHVYEEFDDGHMGITYRYDRSLPFLWRSIRPSPAGARRP